MTRTFLTMALSLWAMLAYTQRIVIFLDNTPNSTPSVSKAILRYDKDFAYSLTFDDAAANAYTVGLPALQGGFIAANNTNYSGLFTTDGCGNNLPFRAGIAWNAANALGIDNHTGNVPSIMTWAQLDDLYDRGWDVFNHGLTHQSRWLGAMTAADYVNEINQNLVETRNKTRNRIEMPAFVVPSSDTYYQDIAYQQGQKIVFDQSPNCIGIGGLPIATDINFNGQVVHRTEVDNEINTGGNKVGAVANRAAAGERIWYNEFTHHIDNFGASPGLNFYNFRNHVERIATNWGKAGTDRMWMAPLQEVAEYLTMRQTATYTATLVGNQLTIDFNLQNVPTWLRRRPLTLVVNSSSTFSRVEVPQGVQMTFNGTDAKKIINLDLAGASTVVINPCDNDVTPPTLTNCPQNINLTTTGTGAIATWTPPTATDNCTTTPSVSGTYASGATFPIGTMPVVYTATDAKGNRSTCNFNVTVTQTPINPCDNDVTPPTLQNCPINRTLTTSGTTAITTWTPPTVFDNCSTPSVSSNYTSGFAFPVGTTAVIYTATDARNNRSTCSFNVIVTQVNPCNTDVTPPVLRNCPTNISLTTAGTSAVAIWTPPTATDNCSTPSVSSNYASGFAFPIGTTAVIYVATDARSNRSTCGFNVIVTQNNPCASDVTPPTFRSCPSNITVTTTGTTAIAGWTTPTATDNCTASPTISSNYPSGQSFPIGSTTVTYAATDARNNRATCSFTVTVQTLVVGETCVSKSDTPWYEWVSRVQFNTLNNVSEKTRNDRFVVGYSDWQDKSTTVSRNRSYPLSISASESYIIGNTMLYYRAWIDFNKNGVFETTEKVLEQTNNGQVVATQSVKIPSNAASGTLRMRVSMKKGSYPQACENFAFGEVEDYSVVVSTSNAGQVNLVQLRPTQLIPIVIKTISPNPTTSDIVIKLESLDARNVQFEFYNAVGTLVKSVNRSLEKGMNTVGFDFLDAPQGVYFIQTDVGKGREVPTKFIKM
jgi:hypothetical protein